MNGVCIITVLVERLTRSGAFVSGVAVSHKGSGVHTTVWWWIQASRAVILVPVVPLLLDHTQLVKREIIETAFKIFLWSSASEERLLVIVEPREVNCKPQRVGSCLSWCHDDDGCRNGNVLAQHVSFLGADSQTKVFTGREKGFIWNWSSPWVCAERATSSANTMFLINSLRTLVLAWSRRN